jgi:hypothetical protein
VKQMSEDKQLNLDRESQSCCQYYACIKSRTMKSTRTASMSREKRIDSWRMLENLMEVGVKQLAVLHSSHAIGHRHGNRVSNRNALVVIFV